MQERDKHLMSREERRRQRGVTVLLVLVFMGVFLLLLGSIVSYVLMQGRYGRALYAREQAFNIAEAGIEHYRWFLAHNPLIMDEGAGLEPEYHHVVQDPEAGRIGEVEVNASASLACGKVQWVDIASTGSADIDPTRTRELAVRYMRPSVAEYSALVAGSVWAGPDRIITGPYFSNGGIRMDAQHNSTVSSAQANWLCDSSFGCSPTQNVAGVFGTGSQPALWSWAPDVASFVFGTIALDFPSMRTYARDDGILLEDTRVRVNGSQQGSTHSTVGDSHERGYYVVFNANNTITVYRVTSTTGIRSAPVNDSSEWVTDHFTRNSTSLKGTYAIPSDCPIIYSDAKLWIEGVVGSKVTIVSADSGSFSPDIVLEGNITYSSGTGSSGLTAVAERNVVVPLDSPENMTVRGIFVAQTGYFGRNHYTTSGTNDVPENMNSYVQQGTMTTIGTVVSAQRIGTKWICGGEFCSGYENRIDTYDRLLAFNPPPFTPAASPDYTIVLWREQ